MRAGSTRDDRFKRRRWRARAPDAASEHSREPATETQDDFARAAPDASSRRLWTWALLLAFAGIAARAAWYVHFADDLRFRVGSDGAIYLTQAQDYLRGAIGDPHAGAMANVYREAYPPGYPLFLAAIWKALPLGDVLAAHEYVLVAVRVVQWILAGATTLMTFALARRVLFGFTALLPPLILTASIALVDMPNLFAYETLLAFLLTAGVLLLVKAREAAPARAAEAEEPPAADGYDAAPDDAEWAVLDEPLPKRRRGVSTGMLVLLAGLALSFAILVQPRVAIVLPFAAAWLVTALPRRFTVGFVLVALLLPAGWIARDYALYGEFVPIAINGQASLYTDNVDSIGGIGFVQGAAPPECPRAMLSGEDMADHFAWARCMQREGINKIAAHPDTSVLAVGDRFAALLSPWNPVHARGNYSSRGWDYHDLLPAGTRADPTFRRVDDGLAVTWMLVYVLLALIGALSLWAEGPGSTARLIALPLVTLPFVHLVFHAENRFRLPLLPLLSIALALGLLWLRDSKYVGTTR